MEECCSVLRLQLTEGNVLEVGPHLLIHSMLTGDIVVATGKGLSGSIGLGHSGKLRLHLAQTRYGITFSARAGHAPLHQKAA